MSKPRHCGKAMKRLYVQVWREGYQPIGWRCVVCHKQFSNESLHQHTLKQLTSHLHQILQCRAVLGSKEWGKYTVTEEQVVKILKHELGEYWDLLGDLP